MNGASAFLRSLWAELRRSLADTVGLFENEGGANFSDGLADVVLRLLVVLILVAIFQGVYRLLRSGLAIAGRRVRYIGDLEGSLRAALRYMVNLLMLLAIATQFGVPRAFLGSAAAAALVAFAFYVGWVIGNRLLTNSVRSAGLDRSLEQLLRNVLAVTAVTLGGMTVLQQFGINVLSVITALGVVGIAVGFAAQETLSNFIAGITLLVERPFRIGDWVEVSGKVGRVEEISLRTTRLIDRDNIVTAIPNAAVASSDIANYSAGGPLRVAIPVGIAYKESAARAREVMLPVVEDHPKVLREPGREPSVLLTELGDSSVNLVVLYWLAPADIGPQPRISAEILEGAKRALDEAGIEIPFPHLQLFIDEAKGLPAALEPIFGRGPTA